MTRRLHFYLHLTALLVILLQATAASGGSPDIPTVEELQQRIFLDFGEMKPTEWGEEVPGVRTRLATEEKVVALTFDACGSLRGKGYDEKLIEYLRDEGIPATLFINARWIDANPETFKILAEDPLFEIENHGMLHRPASVSGRSAYGIAGTGSAAEVVEEIESNARKIALLTGRRTVFYRSGTNYYDEIAVRISETLGHQAVGYSVLGDAGATFSRSKVQKQLATAPPGAIVICHMNHPESETAEGVIGAIPILRSRGFRFVKLEDLPLQ